MICHCPDTLHVCHVVLIASGEMFDNMLQLMRFSVYFKEF